MTFSFFGDPDGRSTAEQARHQSAPRETEWEVYLQIEGFSCRNGLPNRKAPEPSSDAFLFGDPDGNRTRVTAVKGRCLRPLDQRAELVAVIGFEPMTLRV